MHVLADGHGDFPYSKKILNGWEESVVKHELIDDVSPVVGWYRNPSTASKHSVRITYESGGKWKSVQPGLIFVREVDGVLVPSIIDPHGAHLGDALPKLKALAQYAAAYGDNYHRITAVGLEKDNHLIGIDLKDPKVQMAVFEPQRTRPASRRSSSALD